VANVLSAPTLGKSQRGYRGQAEGVVQLAIGEQPTIRGDPSAMEFQLDPAVEGDPERRLFAFTRRVRHSGLAPPPLSL